jgi:hypothetical protein
MRALGAAIALCMLATVASTAIAQDVRRAASAASGPITAPAFHGSETRAAER